MVKNKMFVRSYVWWPGIDAEIKNVVNACKTCLIERKNPRKTPLTTWLWPNKVCGRIHCDFAGPFYGDMYLLIVDAHSKWPEIISCKNNTKAAKVVNIFKDLFTRFRLPTHSVTDGEPQFRSDKFLNFFKRNGIFHTFSPPYHLATNGAAENFVQTFKDKVNKIVKGGKAVKNAVNIFLYDYRNFPNCTTVRSPANLMYNRDLRTRFDKLKPNVIETVENHQRAQIVSRQGNRQIDFNVSDKVLIDGHGVRNEERISGEIVKQNSPYVYDVKTDSGNIQKKNVIRGLNPFCVVLLDLVRFKAAERSDVFR